MYHKNKYLRYIFAFVRNAGFTCAVLLSLAASAGDTVTVGSKAMEARYENLDELSTKKFYLQYRFPPSSVGEVSYVWLCISLYCLL